MRHLLVFGCLLGSVIGLTLDAQAGCRIRMGGCSDPCGASACGSASGCACGVVSSGGNCDSCGTGMVGSNGNGGNSFAPGSAAQSLQAQNAELRNLVDCMPITMYRVVLEPKYFTESRAVCTTEYQDEVRYRTKTVCRTEPVQVQEYRTKTIMVPKTETKTIEYSVLVPETSEKTVELTETVPVWSDVSENYTVKVPKLEDVPEEYEVKVPKLRDEQFTYTVFVPQAETQTKMQTVTNAVPVTKTRTVEVCVPTTKMQMVTKDYGHWETRFEEVGVSGSFVDSACGPGIGVGGCGTYAGSCGGCGPASNGCGSVARRCGRCGLISHHRGGCRASHGCGSCGGSGGCNGCGSAANGCGYDGYVASNGIGQAGTGCGTPTTQTVSRRVWVPNVVTEQVPVVENSTQTQEVAYTVYEQRSEQIPYECTYLVYRPETRTATRKVVDYVAEKRSRTRKIVQYVDETRTRTRRTLSYKQQTKTETIPVVSYKTEKRTKEVSYSFNVPEVQVEPYMTTRYDTVDEQVTEEYTIKVPVATTKEVQVQVCRMVPRLVSYTASPCCDSNGAVYPGAMGVGGCSACGGQTPVACAGCATPCNSCQR